MASVAASSLTSGQSTTHHASGRSIEKVFDDPEHAHRLASGMQRMAKLAHAKSTKASPEGKGLGDVSTQDTSQVFEPSMFRHALSVPQLMPRDRSVLMAKGKSGFLGIKRNPRAIPFGSKRQMSGVFKDEMKEVLQQMEENRIRAKVDGNPAAEYAINQRRTNQAHHGMVINNYLMIALAAIGVICMFAVNEVKWSSNLKVTTASTVLKGVMSLSTILLMPLTLRHYEFKLRMLKVSNMFPPTTDVWSVPEIRRQLIAEMFVLLFHVPVFTDWATEITMQDTFRFRVDLDFFGIVMFARGYLFLRYLFLHSNLNTSTGKFIARLNNTQVETGFAIRAIFDQYPFLFVFFLEAMLIFLAAFAIHLVERPYNADNLYPAVENQRFFWNSFWLLCVTVTTVGYGDQYPVTPVGRMIAVGSAMVGILLTALQVTMVSRKLSLNKGEERILCLLNTSKWKNLKTKCAARVIQEAFRLHRCVMQDQGQKVLNKRRQALYAAKRQFRSCLRSAPSSFEGELRFQFMMEDMYSAMKELEKVMEGGEGEGEGGGGASSGAGGNEAGSPSPDPGGQGPDSGCGGGSAPARAFAARPGGTLSGMLRSQSQARFARMQQQQQQQHEDEDEGEGVDDEDEAVEWEHGGPVHLTCSDSDEDAADDLELETTPLRHGMQAPGQHRSDTRPMRRTALGQSSSAYLVTAPPKHYQSKAGKKARKKAKKEVRSEVQQRAAESRQRMITKQILREEHPDSGNRMARLEEMVNSGAKMQMEIYERLEARLVQLEAKLDSQQMETSQMLLSTPGQTQVLSYDPSRTVIPHVRVLPDGTFQQQPQPGTSAAAAAAASGSVGLGSPQPPEGRIASFQEFPPLHDGEPSNQRLPVIGSVAARDSARQLQPLPPQGAPRPQSDVRNVRIGWG